MKRITKKQDVTAPFRIMIDKSLIAKLQSALESAGIVPGKVVQLKSGGGPHMTVESVYKEATWNPNVGNRLLCVWYDTQAGDFCRRIFSRAALQLVQE